VCGANPFDHDCVVTKTLPAGNDVEMGGGKYSFEHVPKLVEEGKLSLASVDLAVSRVLRAKFAMGLFESPYTAVEDDKHWEHISTKEHKDLAREIDAESIVLLENHDGVLPIAKNAHVAVIGPMAHGYVNVRFTSLP
jgi:beta-glucosidase